MSHYFETPTGPEQRRSVGVRFWETDWTFTTAFGVFSGDGLDLGTGVLLRTHSPAPGARRLLDLGCGYGPIAVGLAVACPEAQVDAVDVNTRALDLTRTNADAHGVGGRVNALLPDEVDPGVRYDEIWSNPPIRIGKEALHDLLLTWLARSPRPASRGSSSAATSARTPCNAGSSTRAGPASAPPAPRASASSRSPGQRPAERHTRPGTARLVTPWQGP